MNDKRNLATYIFSASIFCLAGALIYFTYVISQVGSQLPVILSGIEKASVNAKPVIEEIYKIRDLISPVTSEITELRKQIPPVLEEVKQTRELVPPLLVEIKKTRELTPFILEEVKKTREAIPAILEEVKLTRELVPKMLVKGEKIVKEARLIGKETSEGAVTGIFSGIVKAPFKLIGGMFGSFNLDVDGITKKDTELALKAATAALTSEKIGEPYSWSNPDSGNNGVITAKEKKVINNRDCRLLTFATTVIDNKPVKGNITACLNEDGEWEEVNRD